MDRAGLKDEHETNFELLPWLANGTLDDFERRSVLEHTSGCTRCQEELLRLDELQQCMSDAALASTPTPNLERIRGRIEKRPLLGDFSLFPPGWFAAAAATVAAVAVLWFVNPFTLDQQSNDFTTVSVPMRTGQVQVVFEADFTAADQQALLQRLGLQVVSGPTPTGKFVIEPGADSPRDFARQLQQDPGVAFASDPVSLE